tara:strand:+ start:193 stop:339 length:147 start_codon:yes stop_codon:yes gene_type:complete
MNLNDIASEIIKVVNKTNNNYDAQEAVLKVLLINSVGFKIKNKIKNKG